MGRQHQQHCQKKITWRSVKDTDMRQHGVKLRKDGSRNGTEICTSSWGQTTCQVSTDIRCLWMLFPTAGPVGFQSLGLGLARGDLQPSKSGGTLEPWNLGTLEPWNPGTLEPWNPGKSGILESWKIWKIWNLGTLEP